MALSKIDVANMLTGATPVANGGTALTSGFKNGTDPRPNAKAIAINGDMAISQRARTKSSITATGYYTLDRYKFTASSDATITMSQESLTSGNAYTDGFANALKVDVTTADSSLASGQYALISQAIEGRNLQLLKKGTANAETLTVAFWVKATKTGTSIFEIFDNDNSRQVSKAFTISSSDTWEKKVLNFPADTTGALGDDNNVSLYFQWYLCAGSDYTSGTLSETWTGNTGANRVVGQVNHFDSASNNFHITGFQIEVGTFSSTTIPPFQHESFEENEMRCMRYYQNTWNTVNAQFPVSTATQNTCITTSWNDGNAPFQGMFPVQMRSTPTVTLYARGDGEEGKVNQNGSNKSCSPADTSEKTIGYLNVSSGTNLVYTAWHHVLDAEL